MTTEIEQQFFEAFGIEPEEDQFCLWECKIPELENVPCQRECKYQRHNIYYPEITAEKLLELICISSTVYPITINFIETTDELKEFILGFCIRHSKEVGKQQVRALFKEEE